MVSFDAEQVLVCHNLAMGFRAISPDLKQHALWLLDNGYLHSDICSVLNISQSSLQCWANNLKAHNHVLPPYNPLQGPPWILSGIQMYVVMELI
jgi:hypothetical protein